MVEKEGENDDIERGSDEAEADREVLGDAEAERVKGKEEAGANVVIAAEE